MPKVANKLPSRQTSCHQYHIDHHSNSTYQLALQKAIATRLESEIFAIGISLPSFCLSPQQLLTIGENKRRKNPAPRGPNKFILYRKEIQAQIRKTNPKATSREISKIASNKWENESKEVKNVFTLLANVAKLAYSDAFPRTSYRYLSPNDTDYTPPSLGYSTDFTISPAETTSSISTPPILPSQPLPNRDLNSYTKKLNIPIAYKQYYPNHCLDPSPFPITNCVDPLRNYWTLAEYYPLDLLDNRAVICAPPTIQATNILVASQSAALSAYRHSQFVRPRPPQLPSRIAPPPPPASDLQSATLCGGCEFTLFDD